MEFDEFWPALSDELRSFLIERDGSPLMPDVESGTIRAHLQEVFSFDTGLAADDVIRETARMMREWNLHTPHRRYFGLFNPDVIPVSIAGDALVAAFNPQLAAASHAPASVEIEAHVLRFIESLIGFPAEGGSSTFTSGGMEANHSAVLVALTRHFPRFAMEGAGSCGGAPRLYVSAEAHHSFIKIAHVCGIGRDAVQEVEVDSDLRMSIDSLGAKVAADRARGFRPFLIVATAGTTAAGAIDPLPEIAAFAREQQMWLHADAAWGGGALMSRALRPLLTGIEQADSVTFDAHKWLSVPMGAGMFFCKHREAVQATFGIRTSYMPRQGETPDPHMNTLQWSRRSIGTKLFVALATLGRTGYEEIIDHQAAMGDALRVKLELAGWEVVNKTSLPLVCFKHPSLRSRADYLAFLERVYQLRSVWISVAELSHLGTVLRACITNYRTEEADLDELMSVLQGCLREEV